MLASSSRSGSWRSAKNAEFLPNFSLAVFRVAPQLTAVQYWPVMIVYSPHQTNIKKKISIQFKAFIYLTDMQGYLMLYSLL